MVVENEKPKDKETSSAGQFDHAPDHPRTTVDENGDGGGDSEVYDQPGFPLRRRVDVGVASESSPAATDEGEEKSRSAPYQGGGASGGGGGSVQTAAASKPKRYSSQRQKLGATSGHSEGQGTNIISMCLREKRGPLKSSGSNLSTLKICVNQATLSNVASLLGPLGVYSDLCNQATLSNAASLLGPKGAYSGLCNQATLSNVASLLGPLGVYSDLCNQATLSNAASLLGPKGGLF